LVDKGIADSASIGSDGMDGAGMFYAYAGCDPSNINKVTEILRDLMANPLVFDGKDLARAKTKIRTRLVLQGESSMRRLMVVGSEWLSRKKYSPIEEEESKYKNIDRAALEKLVEKFPLSPITQVSLLPE
jgi:predicted Zn-dependent peptidase